MTHNYDVCVDIDRFKEPKRFYIYKSLHIGDVKLWVTKEKKLDRCKELRGYVYSWEDATILVNKIFAGEIKQR